VTPLEYFLGKPGELEADLRSVGVSRQRFLGYTSRESLFVVYLAPFGSKGLTD